MMETLPTRLGGKIPLEKVLVTIMFGENPETLGGFHHRADIDSNEFGAGSADPLSRLGLCTQGGAVACLEARLHEKPLRW